MLQSVVINGRFLAKSPTGVQRVARELLLAIDHQRANDPRAAQSSWTLLTPPDAEKLDLKSMDQRAIGQGSGNLWEQRDLPRNLGANALLLNLCNVGPLMVRDHVLTIHDLQTRTNPSSYSRAFRAWYAVSQAILVRRAKRVVTVSDYSRRQIVEAFPQSAQKVITVKNGTDHALAPVSDPSILAAHGLRPGGYLLSFASAQPHKNMQVLVDAFCAEDRGETKLALIGAKEMSDPPKGPGIVHLPRVADDALLALYENAVLLAVPSLTEGFGLPPGEALWRGCPSLVADAGALPEIYQDLALCLPPTDVSKWSDAISDVLSGAVELSHRAPEALTWANAAKAYLEIVDEIFAEHLAPRKSAYDLSAKPVREGDQTA